MPCLYFAVSTPKAVALSKHYVLKRDFSKNDLLMKSTFVFKATQFNNYELTMMTLKGETLAGFKIQG